MEFEDILEFTKRGVALIVPVTAADWLLFLAVVYDWGEIDAYFANTLNISYQGVGIVTFFVGLIGLVLSIIGLFSIGSGRK